MTAPTMRVAHTIQAPREPVWYGDPVTGIEHAFVGVRNVCGTLWWTAAWSIVGPIAAVDRGNACGSCIHLTGSTEAELRGLAGDR